MRLAEVYEARRVDEGQATEQERVRRRQQPAQVVRARAFMRAPRM